MYDDDFKICEQCTICLHNLKNEEHCKLNINKMKLDKVAVACPFFDTRSVNEAGHRRDRINSKHTIASLEKIRNKPIEAIELIFGIKLKEYQRFLISKFLKLNK